MNNRIAVAVSGGGRSLVNLLALQKRYGFAVAGVISSDPQCRGTVIAREAGLPVFVGSFAKNDAELAASLQRWLEEQRIQLIALAGFIKRFPCLAGWERRVVNIHPALLPAFGGQGMYGINVHRAVVEARERVTGASIHFVNSDYDEGELIAQVKVPITANDTAEGVAIKVFEAECKLYPTVLRDLLSGHLPHAEGVKIYEF